MTDAVEIALIVSVAGALPSIIAAFEAHRARRQTEEVHQVLKAAVVPVIEKIKEKL